MAKDYRVFLSKDVKDIINQDVANILKSQEFEDIKKQIQELSIGAEGDTKDLGKSFLVSIVDKAKYFLKLIEKMEIIFQNISKTLTIAESSSKQIVKNIFNKEDKLSTSAFISAQRVRDSQIQSFTLQFRDLMIKAYSFIQSTRKQLTNNGIDYIFNIMGDSQDSFLIHATMEQLINVEAFQFSLSKDGAIRLSIQNSKKIMNNLKKNSINIDDKKIQQFNNLRAEFQQYFKRDDARKKLEQGDFSGRLVKDDNFQRILEVLQNKNFPYPTLNQGQITEAALHLMAENKSSIFIDMSKTLDIANGSRTGKLPFFAGGDLTLEEFSTIFGNSNVQGSVKNINTNKSFISQFGTSFASLATIKNLLNAIIEAKKAFGKEAKEFLKQKVFSNKNLEKINKATVETLIKEFEKNN